MCAKGTVVWDLHADARASKGFVGHRETLGEFRLRSGEGFGLVSRCSEERGWPWREGRSRDGGPHLTPGLHQAIPAWIPAWIEEILHHYRLLPNARGLVQSPVASCTESKSPRYKYCQGRTLYSGDISQRDRRRNSGPSLSPSLTNVVG